MGSSGTNRREDRVTLDAGEKIDIRAQLAGGGGANNSSNHRRRMLDPTKMGWKDPGNHME
jgi:hypothetical protein